IHFSSWQVALCCALLLYASVVCWLVAMFDFPSDSPAWINHLKSYLNSSIVWKPFDEGLFYANWFAGILTPVSLPIFYAIRRAKLRNKHGSSLRELEAFSVADPDKLIPFPRYRHEDGEQTAASSGSPGASPESADQQAWSEVLGVPPSATTEEIKRAYKLL